MTCSTIQGRMAAILAGAGDRRDRVEVESHAARCARCATAYADLVAASVALERAYAPFRMATVGLSPARVRLALRRPESVPPVVRIGRLSARLTEIALAAAVMAFAFTGSASIAPRSSIVEETASDPAPAGVTPAAEGASIIRWFRIGRYAASPDVGEPPVTLPSSRDDAQTLPGLHDRAGLQR